MVWSYCWGCYLCVHCVYIHVRRLDDASSGYTLYAMYSI